MAKGAVSIRGGVNMVYSYKGKRIEIDDIVVEVYESIMPDIDEENLEYQIYTSHIDINDKNLNLRVTLALLEDVTVYLQLGIHMQMGIFESLATGEIEMADGRVSLDDAMEKQEKINREKGKEVDVSDTEKLIEQLHKLTEYYERKLAKSK